MSSTPAGRSTDVAAAAGTSEYRSTLAAAKAAIQAARSRAVLAANSELIGLYWELGQLILERQAADGWGTKVDRAVLGRPTRRVPRDDGAVADATCCYMRALAAAWPDRGNRPTTRGTIAVGPQPRAARQARRPGRAANGTPGRPIEHGWSRAVLANQIMSQLHRRAGAAPSNFADVLPAGDSELMQQLTKDPYNLEFLTLTAPVAERDLERALVAQVERFLLELGAGFAFVGRQWRLDLDGDEFFIDLLMFHIPTSRYVVIELKTTKLTPADVGQLNFYVAAVDGEVRLEHHAPTVGLLLCATRNERTVRYALARSTSPMAVAGYRYNELPAAEQAALPSRSRPRRRRQRRPRRVRPPTRRNVTERLETGLQDRLRATKPTRVVPQVRATRQRRQAVTNGDGVAPRAWGQRRRLRD